MRNLVILCALLALPLAGCGSLADPISEDTTAGRTKASVTFNDQGQPKTIEWADGKDKSQLSAELNIKEGSFKYSASDVGATDPLAARAALLEAWGDDTVQAIEQAIPGGIEGLIEALREANVI